MGHYFLDTQYKWKDDVSESKMMEHTIVYDTNLPFLFSPNLQPLIILRTKIGMIKFMAHILDGNSVILVIWSVQGICLTREPPQNIILFSIKNLFSFIRAQDVVSYHDQVGPIREYLHS